MTPYARLMAEQWPTGTFGHAQPPTPPKPHTEPWTTEEQAQHLADLTAALNGWHDPSEQAEHKRTRHLRLIPTTQPDAA
ncbi:hypothetical protein GCM10010294_25290 [Streptomyces griseoloalbus]|nr:hypothetical protein GCM10010294_25290 [Streptomyces griseoloalbus]